MISFSLSRLYSYHDIDHCAYYICVRHLALRPFGVSVSVIVLSVIVLSVIVLSVIVLSAIVPFNGQLILIYGYSEKSKFTSQAMKINISETTKTQLEQYDYKFGDHGTIEVKVSSKVILQASEW